MKGLRKKRLTQHKSLPLGEQSRHAREGGHPKIAPDGLPPARERRWERGSDESTKRVRHGAKRASGVAAVEFALILPVFLTILFAAMDFGWMFFQQLVVTSAARAGARAGALAATDGDATTNAQAAVTQYISENGLNADGVVVTAPVQADATPKTITVTVTMQFDPLVGVLFLPDDIQPYPADLTARSVMVREQ